MEWMKKEEGLKSNVSGFIENFFFVIVEIVFSELMGKNRETFKVK